MAKLYFSKTHEWILVDGSNGKIGISDHAQKELGDLVYVELPKTGAAVSCNKAFCNVESVKAVTEIYSPACGKVIAVNDKLESNPEDVNNDAMSAWIAEIEIESLSEGLMSEEEYKTMTK